MGKARLSVGGSEVVGVAPRRVFGWTLRFAITVFIACALPAMAPAVWAHASLVKASPAARAVLHRPPERIQLWFNERLEARFSSFTLWDAKGQPMEIGAVQVDRDDPKSLSAALKQLAPGRYTVKYRVLSTDGHVVENQFTFTLRPEAAAKP